MNNQTNESIERVFNFAMKTRAGFLATSENNKPHVRGVLLWRANETGLYFHTAKTKDLYHQLVENPYAEIAFFSPDPEPSGTMMRVRGRVEFLEGPELKEELIAERPWLLSYGEQRNDSLLAIFRIVDGVAKFWTNETNMQEKEADLISIHRDYADP